MTTTPTTEVPPTYWSVKPSDSNTGAGRHGDDRWDPWRALALEHPDVRVTTRYRLPGRFMGLQVGRRIWLCNTLDDTELTCTLAHELVHRERCIANGSVMPRQTEEEERIVREITAQRLIPFRDLARVMADRPNAYVKNWAYLLRVDVPTLADRLLALSAVESASLTHVRGGPLPTLALAEIDRACPVDGLDAALARGDLR